MHANASKRTGKADLLLFLLVFLALFLLNRVI